MKANYWQIFILIYFCCYLSAETKVMAIICINNRSILIHWPYFNVDGLSSQWISYITTRLIRWNIWGENSNVSTQLQTGDQGCTDMICLGKPDTYHDRTWHVLPRNILILSTLLKNCSAIFWISNMVFPFATLLFKTIEFSLEPSDASKHCLCYTCRVIGTRIDDPSVNHKYAHKSFMQSLIRVWLGVERKENSCICFF